MIKVEGPNPTTLWRRMEHHASDLIPLVHSLIDALVFGPLGQDDNVHVIRQHKAGANSFSLTLAGGPTYHFRSHDYRTIEVYDSFKHGDQIATASTREEAEALVEELASGALTAPGSA
jgi:hypothetical protein